MANQHLRALILGIDGGSLQLVEEGIATGQLPNLARLLNSSAYGESATTWPAHTAPGWASFVAARQPGGHGIYQFFDTQDSHYGDRLLETPDYGCDTIWEWLNAQGLTVGLINVPMSHPPRGLDGFELTWPLRRTLRFSSPPDLLGDLARVGVPFKPDVAAMYKGEDNYLDLALANVRERMATARHMMINHPTDVMMLVITEVDRVCHHYWHFGDSCHPRHRMPAREDAKRAVALVYSAVDEIFGEILENVDDEVPVLLLSDHGFGPGRYQVALNTHLADAGLLTVKPTDQSSEASWFRTPDGRRTIDFSATAAYMPTPGCYGINVNLQGRQQFGRVRPQDKDRVLSEAADMILGLTAPDTGDPVFSNALTAEQAYPGPHSSKAPDLLFIPADEGVLATPGLTSWVFENSEQTGMHRYRGLWALRAPGLNPGRRERLVDIADLGPLLLGVIGVGVPREVQRESAKELLPNGVVFADYAICTTSNKTTALPINTRLSDHDSISHALAAMGYL